MFDAGAVVLRLSAAGAQEFKRALTEAEKEAQKYADSLGKVGEKTDTAGKASKDAEPKVKSFKEELKEITKEGTEAAKAADKVGKSLLAVGAASVAATGYAAKSAIDWQTAWAGVQKTNDGTHEQMQRLQNDLRQMTKELPASHAEIAAVAEAAGQLGIEVDNVASFTRAMIDLGETTNLSAQDGAMELAKFMNVMKTSQDQTSNLGSAVVDLGNNYATTERDIVAMASRLAGAGKQVGLTEGEVLGLSTALSSVGIEADAGGSAMSKVMIDIAASVDKGGERLKLFADVAGVSADEFSEKWRSSPGEALAMFVQGLADAESQGKSTLGMLETLGISEVRMRDALLKSASAADIFTKAMVQGEEAFEANTALANEAAIRYETVAAKLDIMWNSINDVAISFGQVFLPVIKAVAETVTGFMDLLGDLPEPVQGAISILTALVGVTALLGGGLLLLTPKIVAVKTAMSTLRAESPKLARGIGIATGALKGLGIAAGVVVAVSLAKAVSDWAKETFIAKTSADDLRRVLLKTGNAAEVVKKAFDRGDWAFIGDMFQGLGDHVADMNGRIQELDVLMGMLVDGGNGEQAEKIFEQLAEKLGMTNEELRDSAWDYLPAYSEALVNSKKANNDSADSVGNAADAYSEQAREIERVRNQIKQLTDDINRANGINKDAVQANIDYRRALAELNTQVKNVQKGKEGYKKTLNISTEAGRKNMEMLLKTSDAAKDAADAQYQADLATMSTAEATEKYELALEKSRKQILKQAKALGGTETQLNDLRDAIIRVPDEVEVEALLTGGTKVKQELGQILAIAGALDDSNIKIKISTAGLNSVIAQKDGGVVKYFADGGRERHVAQLAKAGSYRVWAEPETGGEAYIPMSPLKRQRSTAILADVANEFGYQLVPVGAQNYANGSAPTTTPSMIGMRISGQIDINGAIRGVIEEIETEEAMNW